MATLQHQRREERPDIRASRAGTSARGEALVAARLRCDGSQLRQRMRESKFGVARVKAMRERGFGQPLGLR